MSDKLFFEIPDDQEIMVKLVEAIPSNWLWVDGELRASKVLVASGKVEENTGFVVQRFHSVQPTIIGGYNRNEKKCWNPNLYAIMVERKLPGFIRFDEAGYSSPSITLELAKQIAVGFLRKGYRGSLSFYRDCYNNIKYDNPALCEIVFESWHGASKSRAEIGSQSAHIKLEWESRYSGKEDDIAPIVDVCRFLNLRDVWYS